MSKPRLHSIMVLLLMGGCLTWSGSCITTENKYPEFFKLPLRKQHEEFRKLPVDQQFDIYLYAMTKRRPHDLGFAFDLASRGEEIVPFLTDRLKQAESQSTQQKIIYVFEKMRLYSVNLKENEELMMLLIEVVSSMKEGYYKDLSTESLERIMHE